MACIHYQELEIINCQFMTSLLHLHTSEQLISLKKFGTLSSLNSVEYKYLQKFWFSMLFLRTQCNFTFGGCVFSIIIWSLGSHEHLSCWPSQNIIVFIIWRKYNFYRRHEFKRHHIKHKSISFNFIELQIK